jgi:hypothetical protein
MRRTVIFGGLLSVAVAAASGVALIAASSSPTIHPVAGCPGMLWRFDPSRPLTGGGVVPYATAVSSTRATIVRPSAASLGGATSSGTWLDQLPNAAHPTRSWVALMYPNAQLAVRFEPVVRSHDEDANMMIGGFPGIAHGPSSSPCRTPGAVVFSAPGELVDVTGYRDEATLLRVARSVAARLAARS